MKKISRNGIVIGIIILFIGTSFIPNINGCIGKSIGFDVNKNKIIVDGYN